MQFNKLIDKLVGGCSLSPEEMRGVMETLMRGEMDAVQAGALLVALRAKGESVEELTIAARTMLDFAITLDIQADHLLDTCGTGGDGATTFNVSTGSALVAAAAGAVVAKHGNRSVSSHCGSADCLELAGVRIDLSAAAVRVCIAKVGIGFLFAPNFHPAMRHVVGIRKSLGVRTVFNLLGPLTNPARAPYRVIGVFDRAWLEPMAQAAVALDVKRVMVVHSEDGLDEISPASPTHIVEITDGKTRRYTLTPEDFAYDPVALSAIQTTSPQHSLEMLKAALEGNTPASQAIAMNVGAALYIAQLAADVKEGAETAMRTMRSGQASDKLQALIEASRAEAADDA